MTFKIRFADQIVGVFIIVALASIIFVIFMLGSKQRWFAKDYQYKTYFDSAAGLSANMAIQYKGFTIGNIKSFKLIKDEQQDDKVEVLFTIYDTYVDRIKRGSLVEISVSPIGLGNQFRLYPGLGPEGLAEGETIPSINSPEAKQLIQAGLAYIPRQDDSITLLLSRANTLVEDIDTVLVTVQDALQGNNTTVLGRTLGGMEETVTGVKGLPTTVNKTLDSIMAEVDTVLADIKPILANIDTLTGKLVEPDGLVSTVLDTKGTVYTTLESSLKSISGILQNLEKTSAFLPAEMPKVAGLLMDLRTTLKTAEDVLIALTNNPLLKKGIPTKVQTQSNGTSPRDINF
ncbi:MAG: MlaD family protein [Treponema sp.]|jgi:phospholipid/cholesterol/gamma-HCH transport system substrate-binding protein|nr:MlaD family protein [Treponema sp.]